jgi:hypothetical protein
MLAGTAGTLSTPKQESSMIDRRMFGRAISRWLSLAESPVRIAQIVRYALDGTGEMETNDFSTIKRALKCNGWRRERSDIHGERWFRIAARENAA